jgi:hypothetical protein
MESEKLESKQQITASVEKSTTVLIVQGIAAIALCSVSYNSSIDRGEQNFSYDSMSAIFLGCSMIVFELAFQVAVENTSIKGFRWASCVILLLFLLLPTVVQLIVGNSSGFGSEQHVSSFFISLSVRQIVFGGTCIFYLGRELDDRVHRPWFGNLFMLVHSLSEIAHLFSLGDSSYDWTVVWAVFFAVALVLLTLFMGSLVVSGARNMKVGVPGMVANSAELRGGSVIASAFCIGLFLVEAIWVKLFTKVYYTTSLASDAEVYAQLMVILVFVFAPTRFAMLQKATATSFTDSQEAFIRFLSHEIRFVGGMFVSLQKVN